MSGRALSFGSVAEAYERYRPGYPAQLHELVTGYAGRPIRTALEIGAGTGKATRLFARPGTTVTATEPDPAMLAELRRHVPADVRTVQGSFEELPPGGTYDLVYAAAALHWTSPAGRWPRIAAMLTPGGTFASFGGPARLADPAVESAVQAARAPFLDTDEFPSPDGTPAGAAMQWPGTELERSGLFTDVRQVTIARHVTGHRRRLRRPPRHGLRLPPAPRTPPRGGLPRDPGRAPAHRPPGRRHRRAPRPAYLTGSLRTSPASRSAGAEDRIRPGAPALSRLATAGGTLNGLPAPPGRA
ncbi:class I SAM-dependent methyltransferase [Catenuloplanes indicus]|uniref:SAM-dependent methyltransferase n=1 Tax=Catenuloplanes indicus TaxID=137267 RepID=A0AAE3W626_9ACTN|nr:class I SAM-dependent methyltransferase [Catenuloplanes indicus]MDQ0370588.1 SAM-dependent methyltransferase [Catenuloplanes indicus]